MEPSDLKKLFTRERVAKTIKKAPPVVTTVSDLFFPKNERGTWDSPLIPLSEISEVVGVAPVVYRNGEPVVVSGDAENVDYIVPLPIYLEANISAADLMNLKVWNAEQRQAWADRKILNLRKRTALTIEALSAQAVFNGKINHALLAAGGQAQRYTVTFGGQDIQTKNVAAADKWNSGTASLIAVYKLLNEMAQQLEAEGFAGEVETFAGTNAFTALLALVNAVLLDPAKIGVPVSLGKKEINIGGYVVRQMSETYKDPGTGSVVPKLATSEIRMTAKGYTSLLVCRSG